MKSPNHCTKKSISIHVAKNLIFCNYSWLVSLFFFPKSEALAFFLAQNPPNLALLYPALLSLSAVAWSLCHTWRFDLLSRLSSHGPTLSRRLYTISLYFGQQSKAKNRANSFTMATDMQKLIDLQAFGSSVFLFLCHCLNPWKGEKNQCRPNRTASTCTEPSGSCHLPIGVGFRFPKSDWFSSIKKNQQKTDRTEPIQYLTPLPQFKKKKTKKRVSMCNNNSHNKRANKTNQW